MTAAVNPRERIGGNKPPLVTDESLRHDFQHVIKALDDFEKSAADLPPVVEDDDDVTVVAAFVKKVRPAIRRIEELRSETKEPYLRAGETVQRFFKALDKRASDLIAAAEQRVTAYNIKKAQRERHARELEARRLAEEAEAKRRAAAETAESAPAPQVAAAYDAAAHAARLAEQAASAAMAKPADMVRAQTDAGLVSMREDWAHRIDNYAQIDLEKLRPHFGPADIDKAIRSFIRSGGRELSGVRIYAVPKTIIR